MTKDKQTIFELPTWDECEAAIKAETATPLQEFICNNEPAGENDEQEWRKGLAAALTAVREECAQIAENLQPSPPWPSEEVSWRSPIQYTIQQIAAAIRSMKG
jgi:hypothetical protein